MPNNFHLILQNPRTDSPKFNRKRYIEAPADENEEDAGPKVIPDFQKRNLANNKAAFGTSLNTRNERRTIRLPMVIDLVKIDFFKVFNNDLKSLFIDRYGLTPVDYSQFNRTVLFEITNWQRFGTFQQHVDTIIDSEEGTSYEGKPYNLLALMLSFQFIGSGERLINPQQEGLLLTLIRTEGGEGEKQKAAMLEYLRAQNIRFTYSEGSPYMVEIHTLHEAQLNTIVDNFDIIKTVTSSRSTTVRPGQYGEVRREYGFDVEIPEQLTTVGIIDTGFDQNIDPLRGVLTDINYDHTGQGAYWDEAGHGSLVTGLVALGDEFAASAQQTYTAKARIAVIKAIHHPNDEINIPRLITDIRDAKRRHGIRLFNMSLNLPGAKVYNSSYSQFAYELDKLAHEEDILIFLSVGNFSEDSLDDLVRNPAFAHPAHEYPKFFYDRSSTSPYHACEDTNIFAPSDSLNNLSIGALAGNIEEGDNSDVTPLNIYPAYYTRKFHWDYTATVNGSSLKRGQRNKYLNKPDLVYDGGDLFSYDAGIEVLSAGGRATGRFFFRTCGTSIATPLLCSFGAQILNMYPELRTQTVKAILVNAAGYYRLKDLPAFAGTNARLLQSLIGFGKPKKKGLISTENNAITFIIEDEIEVGQIIVMPVNLPPGLKHSGHKLQCKITLCYSFLPVRENHLSYLPLHMSFGLVRNLDVDTIAQGGQDGYGIKKGFRWSEDHHGIENRVFSNAQSMEYTLQPGDLNKVDGSVAIAVRCLVKKGIPEDHLKVLQENRHAFSLVATFTEMMENSADSNLYAQMTAINAVRIIATGDLTGEADLEAEAS
ncbi:S8 family peptidase [Pseudoflavitalea sp. X16]|uniref:S8 family peptidase n=1 Tax=Paraflavitalea devenefica TaxID=2716334 RepID=UPI001424374A|nr:S8 family peptidase [Paraflavitalea devenefica]NII23554.1 S8 family peptidase [Paraflavitalea devenefica]